MTFTESIQTCFRKYANFKGRATKSEFWWWMLFAFLASFVANMLSDQIGMVVSLATLLPTITVTARRLHDTNRSGWWQLIGIVPVFGLLVIVVLCVQDTESESRYD